MDEPARFRLMSDTHTFADDLGKSIPIDWSSRLNLDFQDVVTDLTAKAIAFHRLEAVRPVKRTTYEKIRKTIDCLVANLVKAALAILTVYLMLAQLYLSDNSRTLKRAVSPACNATLNSPFQLFA